MFYFKDIEFLSLLLVAVLALFFIKKDNSKLNSIFKREVLEKITIKRDLLSTKVRSIIFLIVYILGTIALARPQIDNGKIEVESSFIDVVAAIDMSKSMFCDDIYPNRFEFAKNKFYDSLEYLENAKVALIGYSSQTFLISPLTKDFNSLRFLTKNLNLDYLNLKGTDILAMLKSADDLLDKEREKIVLLFTDGGDQDSFEKEIEYAKQNNISVYIYNIGTKKGGVIKDRDGVIKDKNGDIVIVKRDDNIKSLALQSGGAYLNYSLKKGDIKALIESITQKYKSKNSEKTAIRDTKELFYYPLSLAILLLFIALYSIPKRRAS